MNENRCKRCIMPEEYPGITFDSKGVCNYCTQYDPNTDKDKIVLLGKDKLLDLIRSQNKKGEHDCVVPLSGGKDSVYVLYYAVKELGLKPVAVTYDSGYQTQIGKENVVNACEALDVPYVVVEPNKGIQEKMLRQSLRISQITGSFVMTCLNCGTLIKAIPLKVAKQREIPFVLFGDSLRESVRLMKLRSKLETANYEDIRSNSFITNLVETMSRLRTVGMTPWKFVRIIPNLIYYRLLTIYQFLSLGAPFKSALFPNIGSVTSKRGPQIIHFYDYVDWDPVKDLAILERELGWKHPPNRTSRFDCYLNCFGSHEALKNGGITGNGIISCNLIREGLISREEALEKEQFAIKTAVEGCHKIINELGLDDFVLPAVRNGRQSHNA